MILLPRQAILMIKEIPGISTFNNDHQNKEAAIKIISSDQNNLPVCCHITGVKLEEGRRRLAAGDFYFAASKEDKIVGILWVHQGSFYIRGLGYFFRNDDKNFYIYNLMIIPEFKRQGIASYLLRRVGERLVSKDSVKMMAIVTKKNVEGLTFFKQMHFEPIEYIYHLNIFFLNYTSIRNKLREKGIQRRIFINKPEGVFYI